MSRKAFVRMAAMGCAGVHMPGWREGGREEDGVFVLSDECLWRGASKTGGFMLGSLFLFLGGG